MFSSVRGSSEFPIPNMEFGSSSGASAVLSRFCTASEMSMVLSLDCVCKLVVCVCTLILGCIRCLSSHETPRLQSLISVMLGYEVSFL